MLTVAGLLAYSDFYGTHPQISEFSEASGYSPPTVFNFFLSDDSATDVYAGNQTNAPLAIEVLAKATAKPYVFSSQFHILALASVICKPVFSVYPDIPGISAVRNSMHGVCYPRQRIVDHDSPPSQDFDPVHIMWTRATTSPLHGWTPNHFVPLIIQPDAQQKSDPEFLSYAEVVTRGKKGLQKFSHSKEEKKRENIELHTSSRIPGMKVDDFKRKKADTSFLSEENQPKTDVKLPEGKQQMLAVDTSRNSQQISSIKSRDKALRREARNS